MKKNKNIQTRSFSKISVLDILIMCVYTRYRPNTQTLLLRLDSSVSRAMYVVNFFKPYPGDKQLTR